MKTCGGAEIPEATTFGSCLVRELGPLSLERDLPNSDEFDMVAGFPELDIEENAGAIGAGPEG
jgi:hypothetical protein